MNTLQRYLIKYRKKLNSGISSPSATTSALLTLSACGGGSGNSVRETEGFPTSYIPPKPNYEAPITSDPLAFTLDASYREPYWVKSLEMSNYDFHITSILEKSENIIEYIFPEVQPAYNHFGVTGWQHSTDQMKTAANQIFFNLGIILDVSFIEGTEATSTNVIAISQSAQSTSSGYSYFPNKYYEIGMDVFIAKGYSVPLFTSELITNFDYEVLVHEIGHALGLKHPFEASGTNNEVLSSYEDNTVNTAMSYDHNPLTFNGTFRPLDWMALTKLYGVKSTYNAGDDVYGFSDLSGTFVIDGAGIDTISALETAFNVLVDCRPGGHSYVETRSNYITDARQLTISHGSDIENVETGFGNDTVIGNDLNNLITTGQGNDTIFAGDGLDIINSGAGADQIDLSETNQSQDTVILNWDNFDLGFDTIYSFMQGAAGDILDISAILSSVAELLPLVLFGNAPAANFSSGILRVTGNNLTTASDVATAFKDSSGLAPLTISDGERALIISAKSQATGEDQFIFQAEGYSGDISLTQLVILQGNALDIDQWHSDNFIFHI